MAKEREVNQVRIRLFNSAVGGVMKQRRLVIMIYHKGSPKPIEVTCAGTSDGKWYWQVTARNRDFSLHDVEDLYDYCQHEITTLLDNWDTCYIAEGL